MPPLAGCKLRALTEIRQVEPVLVAVNVEDAAGAERPDAE